MVIQDSLLKFVKIFHSINSNCFWSWHFFYFSIIIFCLKGRWSRWRWIIYLWLVWFVRGSRVASGCSFFPSLSFYCFFKLCYFELQLLYLSFELISLFPYFIVLIL